MQHPWREINLCTEFWLRNSVEYLGVVGKINCFYIRNDRVIFEVT